MTNTSLCMGLLRFSSLVFPYPKLKLLQEPFCYTIEASGSPRLPLGESQNSYAMLKTQLRRLWDSHGEWCHTAWPSFFQFRKEKLYCFYTLAAAENPRVKACWGWLFHKPTSSSGCEHICLSHRALLTKHPVLGRSNSIPSTRVQHLQLKINQMLTFVMGKAGFLKQLTSFKKLNLCCYQKRTKYHLKFKGKESKRQVICPRMDSWFWSKPQRLNLIFVPFKPVLQVTLTCATQLTHLKIALDVVALGWTKVNKEKSFQNLRVKILQCSATEDLQNCACNKQLAIQVSRFPKKQSWFMIFRHVPVLIHSTIKNTVAKQLHVTLSSLKEHPYYLFSLCSVYEIR